MSPAASSRWCPTPEQLMILEEMYRGGVRTPNASQIQQITAHLSFYGKIEGKNVFYWFQNHKARDRQKLRRKLSKQLQQHHQQILFQQQQQHHYHFHGGLDTPAFQQHTHYSPASFLPQGIAEDASTQMMNYAWKLDMQESGEMEKSRMRLYGGDLMMMVDVGPTSPCCKRPLKTLELFPITAPSLKDECTSENHLSCSTSTD